MSRQPPVLLSEEPEVGLAVASELGGGSSMYLYTKARHRPFLTFFLQSKQKSQIRGPSPDMLCRAKVVGCERHCPKKTGCLGHGLETRTRKSAEEER